MQNNIHCQYCHEDMNPADWEASRRRCMHCGRKIDPEWLIVERKAEPLVRARDRVIFSELLGRRPAYV